MNRNQLLLGGLGVVLLLVLFWLFLWQPQSSRIDEIETEIEDLESQRVSLEGRIASLEEVRARAPEIEAALAAAESVLPRDAAMPILVRQLQLAAQDSGIELRAINPSRPVEFGEGAPELAVINLSVDIAGSYFQIIDFLRRVEDPAITARGIEWQDISVSLGEYPTLSAVMSGETYAVLPAPPQPGEPEEDETEADGGATEEPTEGES
ncbi:MAG: type II secretion system protein GspM [Nitriliruptorales bacterium]|nr:type II secretion system protein GspM [Nitriliruptorales bacterium]